MHVSFCSSEFKRTWLWLFACCCLWLPPSPVLAALSSVPQAGGCQEIPAVGGACNSGSSLLQLASKSTRTRAPSAADAEEEDNATANSSALGVAVPASSNPATVVANQTVVAQLEANASDAASAPKASALIQAGRRLWLQALRSESRGAAGLVITVIIVIVGVCILCVGMHIQSNLRRRDWMANSRSPLVGSGIGSTPLHARGQAMHPVSQGSPLTKFENRPQIVQARGDRSGEIPNSSPPPASVPPLVRADTLARSKSRPDTLCPGLVVPNSNDCVLVIRVLQWPLDPSRTLDILDLAGKPVLTGSIILPWPTTGPVVTLSALSSSPRGKSNAEVLALCRVGKGSGRGRSVDVYDKEDALFGSIQKDATKSRYALTSVGGKLRLAFDGDFEEHKVLIADSRHTTVAQTDNYKMDNCGLEGRFCKVRISAGVDVGLVMCGMLAIEAMEAAEVGTI